MSMTREQMVHYLKNPDRLNEKTLVELKEILEEYPYFQSAHLLYMRNLLNEKNFRFASQLRISAVHATDRTKLYHLLNPTQKNADTTKDDTDTRSSPAEEKNKQTEKQFMEAVYRLEGDLDLGKTLAQLVKDINESATRHKNEFIQKIMNPEVSESEITSSSDEGAAGNDEFITETLAKIYIKQGLYHKAIDAFQRLKLKYPEKSIYFARQIDEVTNLLNK